MLASFCCIKNHPRVSLVVQVGKNLPAMRETRFQSLGLKVPLEKGIGIHSSILAWWIMDREAWQAIVHEVSESDTNEQLTLSFFTFCPW